MEAELRLTYSFSFAGALHLLAALMLSRPTRNTYHSESTKGEYRDPFVGLDRYEFANHGYGVDRKKTRENRIQALSFGLPGLILFLVAMIYSV